LNVLIEFSMLQHAWKNNFLSWEIFFMRFFKRVKYMKSISSVIWNERAENIPRILMITFIFIARSWIIISCSYSAREKLEEIRT
jgi:hypothetical protein